MLPHLSGLPHLPGVSHLHVNKTLSKVQMLGSDFKQERKREREKNETKQQQQQQQQRTNETNALGARIFSVSYLLSRSQAPLSREQRAQGTTERHNARRVIAAPTFHGWIPIWNIP